MTVEFTHERYEHGRSILRAPVPPEAIDYIPKGGQQLAYFGHAQTTARLLDADPEWTWEPMGYEDDGQPALARKTDGTPYGLWIRLHVCGVHRIGFGELPASKGADGVKEAIGDAIRNAAMRFGVALDLWAKGDLASLTPESSSAAPTPVPPTVEAEELDAGAGASSPASDPPTKKKKVSPSRGALNRAFHAKLGQMGLDYEAEVKHGLIKAYAGRSLSELSDEELSALLARLDDPAAEERFRILCRTATEEATAA